MSVGAKQRIVLALSILFFFSFAAVPNLAIGTPTTTYDLSLLTDSDTNIFAATQFLNNTANPSNFYVGYRSITNNSAWLIKWDVYANGSVRKNATYPFRNQSAGSYFTNQNDYKETLNIGGSCASGQFLSMTGLTVSSDSFYMLGNGGSTACNSFYKIKMGINASENTFYVVSNDNFGVTYNGIYETSLTGDGSNYWFAINRNYTYAPSTSTYISDITGSPTSVTFRPSITRINSAFSAIVDNLPSQGINFGNTTGMPIGFDTYYYPTRLVSKLDNLNYPVIYFLANFRPYLNRGGTGSTVICTQIDASTCPAHQLVSRFETAGQLTGTSNFAPTDLSYFVGALGDTETIVGVTNPDKIVTEFLPDLNAPTTKGWVFMANQTLYHFDFTSTAGAGAGATTVSNYSSVPTASDNSTISAFIVAVSSGTGLAFDAVVIFFAVIASIVGGWLVSNKGQHQQTFQTTFLVLMGTWSVIGWLPSWFVIIEIVIVLIAGGAFAIKTFTGGH